jgi:hypothetical protein
VCALLCCIPNLYHRDNTSLGQRACVLRQVVLAFITVVVLYKIDGAFTAGKRGSAAKNGPAAEQTDPSSRQSYLWHKLLCTVASFHLAFLSLTLAASPQVTPHLVCAVLYVSACAFRSFLPQCVSNRSTLVQCAPLSTAFNDRTVATVGELAFTYQLILQFGMPFELFYMIAAAQAICWIAVLIGYPVLHAIENSLWGLLAVAVALHCDGNLLIQIGCGVFCAYIVFGDIPLYLSKKNQLRSVVVSLQEITAPAVLDDSWNFWKHEVVWMTGYFTFGPLAAIMMCRA